MTFVVLLGKLSMVCLQKSWLVGLLKTLLEVFQGGDHEEVEISFGNMHDNLEEEEMLEFVTRLW